MELGLINLELESCLIIIIQIGEEMEDTPKLSATYTRIRLKGSVIFGII